MPSTTDKSRVHTNSASAGPSNWIIPSPLSVKTLRDEKERGANGPRRLDISWEATETLYDEFGLPPALSATAWRDPIPVYHHGRQVGRATSGVWSPILEVSL